MLDSATADASAAAQRGPSDPVLPVRLRGVGFSAGTTRVLSGVDFELGAGGPTVVMGPNGSGKTTLLKLAAGLLPPAAGTILWGMACRPPPGTLSMLFQKPVMLRRSAAANVAFALDAAGRSSARSDVLRLLELARIAPLADRPARRLSGGEQQRLALARALARAPQLLLLDEPTASLDPAATRLVEEIIASVAASGVTIVMSTHDLGQARRIARDVVFLAKGRLIEHAPAGRFFSEPSSEEARRFLVGDLVV